MFGHRFFGAAYYGPRYWGDGGGIAPPVVDETMYWGLLRKKKKRTKEQVETPVFEELELAEAQSSMQLALQRAMLRKQSEKQLDQFIDGLAAKTSRKVLETEKRLLEEHEMATVFALLL